MQINLFTDYGLRTLVWLAAHPERTFTTSEIAAVYSLSRNHLLKVVQSLASAGYIVATRGVGGGIQLVKSPEEILIGDVVRLLEGSGEVVNCIGKSGPCILLPGCMLKFHLRKAQGAFYEYLNDVTLANCLATATARSRRISAVK